MDTGTYLDTAAYGQYSENVKNIQLALQKLGYWTNPNLKATGFFGEVTRLSLINFERSNLQLTDSDISYVNGNDSAYTSSGVGTMSISDTFKGIHKFIANKLDEVANGKTVNTYTIVANFYLGEMDAVIDTAKGSYYAVTHLDRTAEGIVFLVRACKPGTPESVVMNYVIMYSFEQAKTEFTEADPNKKARMIGRVVGEIAIAVIGTKGVTAAMDAIKASAKSGQLGVWLGKYGKGIKIGDDIAASVGGMTDAASQLSEAVATRAARLSASEITKVTGGVWKPAKTCALKNVKESVLKYLGDSGMAGNPTRLENIHPKLQQLYDNFISQYGGSLKDWPIENCAEWNAINQALWADSNAELSDFVFYTVDVSTGAFEAPCANCQRLFKGAYYFDGQEIKVVDIID
jgi:peptidoglycan hydrolase-like protein with peptidoglycan-binding domain